MKCVKERNVFMQIHHTGEFHWVTSVTIGTVRSAKVKFFDSKQTFRATLPPSLECQLAGMYIIGTS